MRIALLYEHPTWSASLIDRLAVRGVDATPINVGALQLSLPRLASEHSFDLWVNRVNAMPAEGTSPSVVAATAHLLLALELSGQTVINGSQSHRIGGSKAAQSALFHSVGLATPPSVSIHRGSDVVAAADGLEFPVLTKPNNGGSGSGIVRHDTLADLTAAVVADQVDLGIDGTGLVQQVVDSADGMIYRVEMLNRELFYGTTQPIQAGGFNYCATDGCAVDSDVDAADRIELFMPPREIIEAAGQVLESAGTDVGGVEYLIDTATGKPCFYDFNPYSNFISGYEEELGFDPLDRYIDFITS